jgi:hypothetical protein
MARWKVACDACEAAAWIGTAPGGFDAWCEACQLGAFVPATGSAPRCRMCGRAMTTGEPRFIEIYGELQNLAAVLSAWLGDAAPLRGLLPERPRFLSDRNPPAFEAGDPPRLREGLEALARGDFGAAASLLAEPAPQGAEPRRRRALAIALERRGDLAEAERALAGIRGAHETAAVLLGRGALHARRGDFKQAREDFARAGDGYEARWNRAALEVHEAVAERGAPDAARIAAARRALGAPSSAWSDHTVGRLLWTLLVERALRLGAVDANVLRAAETEFEFATFWDRAAVLAAWAQLGAREEAARVAAALAHECAAALADEPALAGSPEFAAAFARVRAAIDTEQPSAALEAVAALLARADLRRYRVPCAACARGSVGVAEFVEDEAGEPVGERSDA